MAKVTITVEDQADHFHVQIESDPPFPKWSDTMPRKPSFYYDLEYEQRREFDRAEREREDAENEARRSAEDAERRERDAQQIAEELEDEIADLERERDRLLDREKSILTLIDLQEEPFRTRLKREIATVLSFADQQAEES
jgi:Fe-S-cluster formation regulator IscX/YfhJ